VNKLDMFLHGILLNKCVDVFPESSSRAIVRERKDQVL